MQVTNVTNDYDNITSSMYTDILNNYDNITFHLYDNCTNIEKNIDIVIPEKFFSLPCGLSFFCLISIMEYTLINPLFYNKWIWRNIYIHIILYVLLYVVLLT